MTEEQRARWVRDVALMYLGRFGRDASVHDESGRRPALRAEFGSTQVLLTVPFRGGPVVSRADPRLTAEAAALGITIEYVLEIRRRNRRVARFRWRDLAGPIACLSFRPGAWRAQFIDVATRRMSIIVIDEYQSIGGRHE
jgi:hypothetical protein